tara:strand:- start:191 stop:763 length:573 start_codon:yes stop_codon:yes gene_type:complete
VTSGNGAFKTFDGYEFSYMGNCEYNLVEDASSGFGVHFIDVLHSPFPKLAVRMPFTNASVDVILELHTNATLNKLRGFELGILDNSGRPTILTYETAAGTDDQVTVSYNNSFDMADLTVLITQLGVSVNWDGQSGVTITAASTLKQKVTGLCGDYNDNSRNDFLLVRRNSYWEVTSVNQYFDAGTCNSTI